MKFTSTSKPLDGILKVEKRFPDGRCEPVFEEQNLIMLPPKQKILSTIYAETVTPDPVRQLRVGIGGTIDPQGLYPKPVAQDMTSLYSELVSIVVSYTVNNNVPSVTFIADLDQGMGNGSLITEAGLFTDSGAMFNIKTFPGVPKTSEFNLHFEWTIKIA